MDTQQAVEAQFATELAESREHQSAIDLAVGVLIQMLSVDEDRAFEILRGCSLRHDMKMHALATRLVAAAAVGDTPADCEDHGESLMERILPAQR